jgi:hypothetical protein
VFLASVSLAYEWLPAELWLVAQSSRWASVKGPREECVFRLTCGLKWLLLYEGGKRGTNVPRGLHTTVAPVVEFTGIFLLLSMYQDIKYNYHCLFPCLFPCLQGVPDAVSDMVITR